MKTVLITGASGFLGNVITKHYLIMGSSIIKIGRQQQDDIFCDLTLEIPKINFNKIDYIIHSAGKAHSSPKNLFQQNEFYEVNFKGTLNLLKALTVTPPEKFVLISTVAVYGKNNGVGICENSSLLATDPYGESKKLAEDAVIEWCNKYNVKCTILRLPLVVGRNPKGNLKSMINGIQKAIYYNIGSGNARKSMVLAEDVAKHLLKAADVGGIYNLTDGYHPNFKELSSNIANQLGKKKPMSLPLWLVKIIAKFGDIIGDKSPINSNKLEKITSTLTFDDFKAREAFGWNPTPVLKGFKLIDL